VESWIETVTAHWPGLSVDRAAYGTGLINDTRRGVLAGEPVIVQRVHPAFAPSVHVDIEAVTEHLHRKRVVTTRLVRSSAGELSAIARDGRAVRVLTFVAGTSRDKLPDARATHAAGALVASFHAALLDLDHTYVHTRPGIHDLAYRLAALDHALDAGRGHPHYDAVAAAADEIRARAPGLLGASPTRLRHAHGDLKASNLLFDDAGRGLAIVDLDTIAAMSWPFEMGDALRSWCNPHGEDVESPAIDVPLFEGALEGYATGAGALELGADEVEALVTGIETIATELAIRFLTDTLEERYFGWDASRYATRGAHNLVRARGQWALAVSVLAARRDLEAIVTRTLLRRRG
jgi:Ser/Thr protein kinase RdoA (MazF antagonist)